MQYVGFFGGVAGVFLLACLSPGPVWLLISSTSVSVSRRAGVLTGLGVAGATATWASLAMVGIGVLTSIAWLADALRLAGAGYLVWIGVRMIGARRDTGRETDAICRAECGDWVAVRRGYLSSMTNPKAAAFFGSIFVVLLPSVAPGWVYATAVILLAVLSAAWHCGLALMFSLAPVQAAYRRAKFKIDTLVGAVLIALGVRLAVAR